MASFSDDQNARVQIGDEDWRKQIKTQILQRWTHRQERLMKIARKIPIKFTAFYVSQMTGPYLSSEGISQKTADLISHTLSKLQTTKASLTATQCRKPWIWSGIRTETRNGTMRVTVDAKQRRDKQRRFSEEFFKKG